MTLAFSPSFSKVFDISYIMLNYGRINQQATRNKEGRSLTVVKISGLRPFLVNSCKSQQTLRVSQLLEEIAGRRS
jgi:hypothetical protein